MDVATDRLGIPMLRADDVEGAHRHISSVYIPHTLVPREGPDLRFKMAYFRTPRLTFGQVTYGAETELACPAMGSCYHLNLTLDGHTRVLQSRRQAITVGRRSGAIFNPDDAFRVRWSGDAVQHSLKLPAQALEEQLAVLLGYPPRTLAFQLTMDLADDAGRSLLSAVNHLRMQYSSVSGRGASAGTVIAQLESYILSQVLLTAHHNYRDELAREPVRAGRQHIRRAIHIIENRSAEPWTVELLAREVCVGVRALQSGFRSDMQMTPMEYLREVRLLRVRDELLGARDRVQVSQVATRWGFTHLGRFARHYRERFGVLPSNALQDTVNARTRRAARPRPAPGDDPRGRPPDAGSGPSH